MVLVALALLLTNPVREKTEMAMNHEDRNHHVTGNTECTETSEKANDEAHTTQKFSRYGQKGKERWYVHLLSEKTHRAAKSIPTEPAERLLCAVCKENNSEHETEDGQGEIIRSVHEFLKH